MTPVDKKQKEREKKALDACRTTATKLRQAEGHKKAAYRELDSAKKATQKADEAVLKARQNAQAAEDTLRKVRLGPELKKTAPKKKSAPKVKAAKRRVPPPPPPPPTRPVKVPSMRARIPVRTPVALSGGNRRGHDEEE